MTLKNKMVSFMLAGFITIELIVCAISFYAIDKMGTDNYKQKAKAVLYTLRNSMDMEQYKEVLNSKSMENEYYKKTVKLF